MVMMTHDLFETYRFHLLPNAEKPTQVLARPSIWLLCGQNRSAVEILDQDLTNTAKGRAMILAFFSFSARDNDHSANFARLITQSISVICCGVRYWRSVLFRTVDCFKYLLSMSIFKIVMA
jgi:hypothetical protein